MVLYGKLLKILLICVLVSNLISVADGKGKKKKKKKAVDEGDVDDALAGKFFASCLLMAGDGFAHGYLKMEQFQEKRNQTVFNKYTGKPKVDKHGRPVNETVEVWVTRVAGTIFGLSPGLHGLHVHSIGNLDQDCRQTGQDFNPLGSQHGPPDAKSLLSKRHVGDLGNIMANATGIALVNVTDDLVKVTGNQSIVGRSIAIHQYPDDLGGSFKMGKNYGPPTWKQKISEDHGNAGIVVACGVVGYVNNVDLKFTEIKPDPHFIRLAVLSCVVMMLVAAVLKCAEGDKKPGF